MKTLHLYGKLKDEIGDSVKLAADTPYDLIRGISIRGDDIEATIRNGEWHIIKGEYKGKDSYCIEDSELTMKSSCDEWHLVPAIRGSGSIGRIILGVVIIGAAIVFSGGTAAAPLAGMGATAFAGITYGAVAMFGVGVALSGVAGLMAPTPKLGSYSGQERADEKPSFMFNGPVNISTQGQPVPLLYGRFNTGSYVVSIGIDIVELPLT